MKIYIAAYQPNRTGGGWSFADNFVKGMGDLITTDYNEADIYFIVSPSMVQRDEVAHAKNDGKKIVLRIDNAVRNSRNRNTGMTRMYDFAERADLVIYQSDWAQAYLSPFTNVHGEVILNGVDLGLFHPPSTPAPGDHILYSRFNRDETKNYEAARYWFSRYFTDENPHAHLDIVGQFSEDLRGGNFDFYAHETYRYLGVLSRENMAELYRQCGSFLYTYFNDACSNSLIEALVSGCDIVGNAYYQKTGGAPQIISEFHKHGRDRFSIETMCSQYKAAMEAL